MQAREGSALHDKRTTAELVEQRLPHVEDAEENIRIPTQSDLLHHWQRQGAFLGPLLCATRYCLERTIDRTRDLRTG